MTFDSVARDMIQALNAVGGIKIDLEMVTIPNDEYWGTADSLRHIKDKIKVNTFVIHSYKTENKCYNSKFEVVVAFKRYTFSLII